MVLPVRDGARTIDGAIRSVLASRGVELELICVDDGSSDRSAPILEDWARCDSRIRVLHTPPCGLVSALNTGIACARSRRIARMDADDEMHPERLAIQAALLDDDSALALVGCVVGAGCSALAVSGKRSSHMRASVSEASSSRALAKCVLASGYSCLR